MGWRILRAGFLVVKDAEKSEKIQLDRAPDPVQWVSVLYECNTKWMKLEVKETKSVQLPQMSLILKPNAVNITFASNDPTFIVCVESKRVGNVTLCFSPESYDTYLSPADVLEWQTLFKSAISPSVTYAVTMIQDDSEQPAILCVTERSVQLSVAERATHGKVMKRKASSVISTDVDGIKLTVEDTLMLTLNREAVTLRTNRLVELYQHLMSYFTGRRTAAGDFDIANFDYINTRRESRNRVLEEDENDGIYIPYEDPYGYVTHSPSPRQTPNTSPSNRRKTQSADSKPSRKPPTLPSPDSARSPLTKLPKLAPQHLSKVPNSSKPEPPPKPKNAREILSEFEGKGMNSFGHSAEPIYKSIRKPKPTVSTSSIGIGGLSEGDSEEAPALPATPPEYASLHFVGKRGTSFLTQPSGFDPEVDYMNVNPRRSSSSEMPRPAQRPEVSARRTSEDSALFNAQTTRFINRQKAIRSPARPTLPEEEENELYDSIYSLGIYSDPSDAANLPPPRESWLTEGDSLPSDPHLEDFPQFDDQRNVPRKILISKIQLFDKKILRKVN